MPTDPVHHGDAERWGGWSWREPHRGEHFRRCTYCGSIHPGDLALAIHGGKAGAAEWADQKYGWPHKLYVDVPSLTPEAMVPNGSASYDAGPDYVAVNDLTPAQTALLVEHGYSREDAPLRGWYHFGTRPQHHVKFYTAHLADPDFGPNIKDEIARWSGLRFTWLGDGRARWEPVGSLEASSQPTHPQKEGPR